MVKAKVETVKKTEKVAPAKKAAVKTVEVKKEAVKAAPKTVKAVEVKAEKKVEKVTPKVEVKKTTVKTVAPKVVVAEKKVEKVTPKAEVKKEEVKVEKKVAPVTMETLLPKPEDDKDLLIRMLQAGVHFGHQVKRWNPKMSSYIWKAKDGVHVFDLLKVLQCLKDACKVMSDAARDGKTIVFVGTKRQASEIVKAQAIRAGVAYVDSRWAGGTLTNWEQVKKSVQRLKDITEGLPKGKFNHLTKRERVMMEKDATRLNRLFGGLVNLKGQPDIIFIVDANREKTVVAEAISKGVHTVAIVDSNCNPEILGNVIPGNDDAEKSVELLVSKIADAVIAGRLSVKKA